MIPREELVNLYLVKKQSMQEIASHLGCSLHRVKYWIDQHGIKTRSISDAIYTWHNPTGDPFKFDPPKNAKDFELFGMGLGLYLGEGTKSDRGSVRLGNTNPELIKVFIKFLRRFFRIKKKDLKLGLQIFTDINENEALDFWTKRGFVARTLTRAGLPLSPSSDQTTTA